jgi:hypothetical protein
LVILVEGWIPESCFREFVEALVHLLGNDQCYPGARRMAGTMSLDTGGHLDEFYWQRLRTMVALSERSISNTWVGLSWEGACAVRCELQRDDGYSGVCVRIEVPSEWADRVKAVIAEVTAIRTAGPVPVVVRAADSPPAPVPVPERRPAPPRPMDSDLELRPELIAVLRRVYAYMVRSPEYLG